MFIINKIIIRLNKLLGNYKTKKFLMKRRVRQFIKNELMKIKIKKKNYD